MDVSGKSDPFVLFYTVPDMIDNASGKSALKSSVCVQTLNPV